MSSEGAAIAYGLASAASWGTGDFSGGVATKRAGVYSVIILAQFIGGTFLAIAALLVGEKIPSAFDLGIGAVAGICGAFGLVGLYSGLARSRMGLVAPLTAVISAILPIAVGAIFEGLPTLLQLVGFGLALVAVWLLAGAGGGFSLRWEVLGLPLLAGAGFGLFFILIDQLTPGVIFWPLVSARAGSIMVMTIFFLFRGRGAMPKGTVQFIIIALAGIFDTGGNFFFALATQAGRLDISAILSSLYPAMTVLLAWMILKERLTGQQWLGVGTALVALVFIAL